MGVCYEVSGIVSVNVKSVYMLSFRPVANSTELCFVTMQGLGLTRRRMESANSEAHSSEQKLNRSSAFYQNLSPA